MRWPLSKCRTIPFFWQDTEQSSNKDDFYSLQLAFSSNMGRNNESFFPQVFGDKDSDGFYWGEVRGKRGFIPHNAVREETPDEVIVKRNLN